MDTIVHVLLPTQLGMVASQGGKPALMLGVACLQEIESVTRKRVADMDTASLRKLCTGCAGQQGVGSPRFASLRGRDPRAVGAQAVGLGQVPAVAPARCGPAAAHDRAPPTRVGRQTPSRRGEVP